MAIQEASIEPSWATSPPSMSTRIVNAANGSLLGAVGLTGLSTAPQDRGYWRNVESFAARLTPTAAVGQAVATRAGNLPARWVIPLSAEPSSGTDRSSSVASCFKTHSRKRLSRRHGRGISAISAGVFGWDTGEVAVVAVAAVRVHLTCAI